MDVSPRRRIVQRVLSETLSRIRRFDELNVNTFAESVQDLPAMLREWADQMEDPRDIAPRLEIPDLGGYALWADNYDDLDGNPVVAGEEETIGNLIGEVQGLKVLDVGFGTARHALRLAEKGARVVGFEPTLEMLEKARGKAEALGLNLDLRHGSIEDLGLDLGVFDLVLCCLVLSHVEDLEDAIGRIGPHVAKGGRLIISDFHPVNILLGFRTTFSKGKESYVVPNFLHIPSDYFQALRKQGMNVIAFEETGCITKWPGLPMTLIMMGHKPY